MATSRRVGTNEQVQTYGVSRDFSSLGTWESATDTDHVSDAETDVLECYDDAASFDDWVRLAGSTNNASFFRIIRPSDAEGHDGTPNVGVAFRNTAGAGDEGMRCDEEFSQFQDLIISNRVSQSGTVRGLRMDADDCKAIGCLVWETQNQGTGSEMGVYMTEPGFAILCLAVECDQYNFRASHAAGTPTRWYNCVSIDAARHGYSISGSSDVLAINCIADGSGSGEDFEAGEDWGSSDFNSSEDTSAPGGNSRLSQSFSFIDGPNDDYHLEGFDTGAKDFGTSLEADGAFDFDDDIDIEPFDVWDIGFDDPDPDAKPGVSGFQGFQNVDGEEWS